jgi:hypothetical protein
VSFIFTSKKSLLVKVYGLEKKALLPRFEPIENKMIMLSTF